MKKHFGDHLGRVYNVHTMPKKESVDGASRPDSMLAIRVTPDVKKRFLEVLESVKKRQKYINSNKLLNELLGLSDPPTFTQEELEYFQGKRKDFHGKKRDHLKDASGKP